MIVRIDTTNLTRGREFTIYAKNASGATVTAMAVDVMSGIVYDIDVQHSMVGGLDAYDAVAPQIDGYFMAVIGKQKVVKKIGNPILSFALGYLPNYTVEYMAYSGDGEVIESGTLTDVGNGFYYTLLDPYTALVSVLNKNFIVNKNLLKMNYEISITGGELSSSFEDAAIDNMDLPNIELPNATLGNTTLDSTMPDVEIKEL